MCHPVIVVRSERVAVQCARPNFDSVVELYGIATETVDLGDQGS